MLPSTLLTFAGCATAAYLTPVGFKNCPSEAIDTLDVLASDALEVTGVVRSMLKLVDSLATPPATLVPGSLTANVRHLIVRWFGEPALPEYHVSENGLEGFAYLTGLFDRMHTILQHNTTKAEDYWLQTPTFHCTFHDDICVTPAETLIESANGNIVRVPVLEPTGVIAYVSPTENFDVHFCPMAVNHFNTTWDEICTKAKTHAPNYYDWKDHADFPIIIHELTHLPGVNEWKHIKDIRTNTLAAFRDYKMKMPRYATYGPAAAQWLAYYAPDLAMYNADNYAGFAWDLAFLSEGHMPPGWDWSLFGWPDAKRAGDGGERSRVKAHSANQTTSEGDKGDPEEVQALWKWTI